MPSEAMTMIDPCAELLTKREALVIHMRFGLGEFNKAHTLREIGLAIGVTRERIRQIEHKALWKLRRGPQNGRAKMKQETVLISGIVRQATG